MASLCDKSMIPKLSPSSGRGLSLASNYEVDCWIGVVQQVDQRLVRLAGRLSVAQVPELLEACAGALPIEINLADLVSADPAGIEALQRLRERGATLVSAPGYLQLKLDSRQGGPAGGSQPAGVRSKDRK
jgi:ABC-type transporter Mla MlaB component